MLGALIPRLYLKDQSCETKVAYIAFISYQITAVSISFSFYPLQTFAALMEPNETEPIFK